ncbi:DUF1631 family protein [Marilutibacter chinensis]|uniref:DUF1631 domain-containing protein n=1 Tax=Marilutibacter chinensis TaxID=2912247 RepID=A0ABS9HU45_9GAMM|nr:DUF1631 family protein [Lysobacter chinensis]MCF7221895.1 DUF1631 domain-containing protein [Lysobacter chinensis]
MSVLTQSHATRSEPLRVLEEIKRQAVEQLGGIPDSLYPGIEQALSIALQSGDVGPGHFEDLTSLRMLRQQAATLLMRYRQQLAKGFDDFRGLRVRTRGDLPLGLIEDSHLAFHLDGQRVVEALGGRFAEPLQAMRQRLHAMAEALGMPEVANPVGPERLVAAFVESFRETEPTQHVRDLLFRQYEGELTRRLGDFYGKANALLAATGYGRPGPSSHTSTQHGYRHETVEAVPYRGQGAMTGMEAMQGVMGQMDGYVNGNGYGGGHAGAPGGYGGGMAMPGQDMADLRTMLRMWRDGSLQTPQAGGAAALAQAPAARQDHGLGVRRELRVDEMLSVVSLLQSEPPDAFARALAGPGRLGSAIRDHLSDGARRIGVDPSQTRFSADEEDAIDLVALLFDSLFRTNSLQDRARRLYGRLVLPYVKVALTDDGLFVHREHPARKLLDAITEACEGNQASTPQERELLDRAAAASQRVVAEYNEDIAVFELAHAELDALLGQHRRRSALQEERLVKATLGRERLDQARETADEALMKRLRTTRLTPAVADFLAMPWRHHIVQTLLRDEDPQRREEAIALGDALLRADQLAAENRGRELADHLLSIEPLVLRCLASSGLDDSAAQHGMAGLVRALATPDGPRRAQTAKPLAGGETVESGEERRLWLAGGTATIGHDPAIAERMRALKVGDWVRLTDVHGEIVAAKVAWISPMTSRFLLVNRRGLRVLVASAEELAVMQQDGRLVVGSERSAFDEAMRRVRERLDNTAEAD